MEISLLDARSVARRLSALIDKHDQISIAVAWGGITPVAEKLLANRDKLASILLGVDFSATDPELIRRFIGVRNAFVAKNRPGCFHPKIYYFQSGASAEAIIGSANFTRGGNRGRVGRPSSRGAEGSKAGPGVTWPVPAAARKARRSVPQADGQALAPELAQPARCRGHRWWQAASAFHSPASSRSRTATRLAWPGRTARARSLSFSRITHASKIRQ